MVLVSILFAILAIAGFVLTLQWLKVKITVTVPNQYEEMFISLAEDYHNKLSFGTFDFVMDDNSDVGEDEISDIIYEDEDGQQYDNEVNNQSNNDLLDQLPHNIIPKTTTTITNKIEINNDNDSINNAKFKKKEKKVTFQIDATNTIPNPIPESATINNDMVKFAKDCVATMKKNEPPEGKQNYNKNIQPYDDPKLANTFLM